MQKVALSITRDPDLAEDLAQETLETRLRQPDAHGHPNPRGWLAKVMRNRAYQHFRSQRRREGREASVGQGGQGTDPADDLGQREAVDLMHQAIDKLDPEAQSLVRMRYFEDLSVRQIAAAEGLSEGAVEYRLRKSRATLRTLLSKDLGIEPGRFSAAFLPLLGLHPPSASAPTLQQSRATPWAWAMPLAGVLVLGSFLLPPLLGPEQETTPPSVLAQEPSNRAEPSHDLVPFPATLREEIPSSDLMDSAHVGFTIRTRGSQDLSPLPDVEVRLLYLKRPSLDPTSPVDTARLLFEKGNPAWEVLQEKKVQTGEDGSLVLHPPAGIQAIRVLPGFGNATWVLGRPGLGGQPILPSQGSTTWPDLELTLDPRRLSVSGSVTTQDGLPVPHAEVHYWIEVPTYRKSRPDGFLPVASDGTFHLEAATSPGIAIVLQPHAPGHLAMRQFRFRPEPGDDLADIELHLTPGTPFLLQVSDTTSLPVEGVQIAAMQSSVYPSWTRWFGAITAPVQTDSAGQAILLARQDRPITLFLSHKDFLNQQTRIPPRKVKRGNAEIQLVPRSPISGRVLDGNGDPREGVTVLLHPNLGSWLVQTDSEGGFRLPAATSLEDMRVVARQQGTGVVWSPFLDASEAEDLTLILDAGQDISGRIHAPGASPTLDSLTVYPMDWTEDGTLLKRHRLPDSCLHLDADGHFRIEGIPEGEYLLTYAPESGRAWSVRAWAGQDGIVLSADTANGRFGILELEPSLDSRIPAGTTAHYRLLHKDHPWQGDDYENIIPRIPRSSAGRFRTGWVSAGEYVLCAYHPGQKFFHQHVPVEIRADTVSMAHPRIKVGKLLQVHMVDEEGHPVTGFRIKPMNSAGIAAPVGTGAMTPREGIKGFRVNEPQTRQYFNLLEDDSGMRFHVLPLHGEESLFSVGAESIHTVDGIEVLRVVIPETYR